MTHIGHNDTDTAAKIKSTIERVERLQEEVKAIQADIKDVYAEAKGFGLDVPTIKRLISERKLDEQKRKEQRELMTLYAAAVQMEMF